MFSSISSINAIATKARATVIPTPNTHFTFNTEQTSGTTVTAVVSSASVDSTTLTLTNSSATITTGQKEGTACFFGGNKLYSGKSTNILLPASIGISISFWFKSTGPSVNGGYDYLFGITGGTNDNVFMYSTGKSTNTIILNMRSTGANWVTFNVINSSVTNIYDNNWHHLVLTWQGTNVISYLDNIIYLNTSGGPSLNTSSNYTTMTVNTRPDLTATNYYGVLNMDCLRLYNKVLSKEEIKAIYTAGI